MTDEPLDGTMDFGAGDSTAQPLDSAMSEEQVNGEVAMRLGDVLSDKDMRQLIGPIVIGALRQCIHVHGPITRRWVYSASKRVVTQITGRLKSERLNGDYAAIHQTRSSIYP